MSRSDEERRGIGASARGLSASGVQDRRSDLLSEWPSEEKALLVDRINPDSTRQDRSKETFLFW